MFRQSLATARTYLLKISPSSSIPVRGLASVAPAASSSHEVKVGVILKRDPIVLPRLSPFEEAYFRYKDTAADATAEALPTAFYFKQGSIAEQEFRERGTRGKGPSAAEGNLDSGEVTRTAEEGNLKSWNRALDRTLYLVVKKPRQDHAWQFVQGGVESDELLHQGAEREMKEECGEDLEFWLVGKRPVAHHIYKYSTPQLRNGVAYDGAKVFFMYGHAFGGQVQPDGKEIVDFAWITKEGLAEYLDPNYYNAIKDVLVE
ncbi:hypothetical protein M427DRAFT_54743 [Gonapodya prolifera JEL478]|uniref:Large ribosomal subunit protein mL46 n=1 Tax=Gonapodya prolifera (strain JEL478) TaxID=1344416 RepID=A0A139AJY5_GONPJ|nr:hypothetical protein M427DRAFT_54743 [Gonapodya prolifera JEL478]|eukprot:KXS17087.1 hypothetical protein M427DRAFT_54743 [Gonapodya prolifera JEL478]